MLSTTKLVYLFFITLTFMLFCYFPVLLLVFVNNIHTYMYIYVIRIKHFETVGMYYFGFICHFGVYGSDIIDGN